MAEARSLIPALNKGPYLGLERYYADFLVGRYLA
jgi:hypothetical protein